MKCGICFTFSKDNCSICSNCQSKSQLKSQEIGLGAEKSFFLYIVSIMMELERNLMSFRLLCLFDWPNWYGDWCCRHTSTVGFAL